MDFLKISFNCYRYAREANGVTVDHRCSGSVPGSLEKNYFITYSEKKPQT